MGIFNKTKNQAADEDKKKSVAPATSDVTVEPVATVAVKEAKEAKVAKASKTTDSKKKLSGILVSPLSTEKSSSVERYRQYTFLVATTATKNEIKKAIESRYGVKPLRINILNRIGKVKRFGRNTGKRKDTRKAIVTLPIGKSINVYETK